MVSKLRFLMISVFSRKIKCFLCTQPISKYLSGNENAAEKTLANIKNSRLW